MIILYFIVFYVLPKCYQLNLIDKTYIFMSTQDCVNYNFLIASCIEQYDGVKKNFYI